MLVKNKKSRTVEGWKVKVTQEIIMKTNKKATKRVLRMTNIYIYNININIKLFIILIIIKCM